MVHLGSLYVIMRVGGYGVDEDFTVIWMWFGTTREVISNLARSAHYFKQSIRMHSTQR